MRTFRKIVSIGLPVLGIVIVLSAVLFLIDLRMQIGAVLVGLILIEAGTWRLAQPFLPNERKYVALREEVDRFINLARRLNEASVARISDGTPVRSEEERAMLDAMHGSVDRMARLAGESRDDLAETEPRADAPA